MAIITQELANRRSCAKVNTDNGLSAPAPPAAAAATAAARNLRLTYVPTHTLTHTRVCVEVELKFGPFGRNLLAHSC